MVIENRSLVFAAEKIYNEVPTADKIKMKSNMLLLIQDDEYRCVCSISQLLGQQCTCDKPKVSRLQTICAIITDKVVT